MIRFRPMLNAMILFPSLPATAGHEAILIDTCGKPMGVCMGFNDSARYVLNEEWEEK